MKTRPQYNFPIKNYDKRGTFRQMEKISVSLISSPINIHTPKKLNTITRNPKGCIVDMTLV